MKYIKLEPFKNIKNEPFQLTTRIDGKEETVKEANTKDILLACLNLYQPNPQLGHFLSIQELRTLNKVFDALEGKPENKHLKFEDTEFEILKKVVLWYAPFFSPRNAPLIEDMLSGAKDKIDANKDT